MRRGYRPSHLGKQRQQRCQRRVRSGHGAQRPAGDEFHDDETTRAAFAYIMHGNDVGMIEGRSGLGFLDESAYVFGVAGEFGRQYFDRDLAIQSRILCNIDIAHSTSAELGKDTIMGNRSADHKTRVYYAISLFLYPRAAARSLVSGTAALS